MPLRYFRSIIAFYFFRNIRQIYRFTCDLLTENNKIIWPIRPKSRGNLQWHINCIIWSESSLLVYKSRWSVLLFFLSLITVFWLFAFFSYFTHSFSDPIKAIVAFSNIYSTCCGQVLIRCAWAVWWCVRPLS